MKRLIGVLALMAAAAPLGAQTSGAISGTVTDAETGGPVSLARIVVDNGRFYATTDSAGAFRVRGVQAGWHQVQAGFIGYRSIRRDSVLVQSGATTVVAFALAPAPAILDPIVIRGVDSILDPLNTSTTQRITAQDLRQLPVSSLDEALALSAGAVGESYRGGRLGQESFILDGLGVKNQLTASTGDLGLRIPPAILQEASLTTNAFSARYGQAISGLVNVVTKDGGDRWSGSAAYETDRPFGNGWDYGLDRVILQADGPLAGRATVLGVVDASGRLDADPVNAPASGIARDPRNDQPWLLPHNSGERLDFAGKITLPAGDRHTVRFFGLRSAEQRLLYDPAFKYEPALAPAQRVTGTLLSAWLNSNLEVSGRPLLLDMRLGWYTREFIRGTLTDTVDYAFGAFTGNTFHFVGEQLARAQDTVAASAPIAGLAPPGFSDRTPWGVPAFFLGGSSRGDIGWNRYRELRAQVDGTLGVGTDFDIYAGGQVSRQKVQTFQRIQGYSAVGGTVPPAVASTFTPTLSAVYTEAQARFEDLAITGGVRVEHFDGGSQGTVDSASAERFGPRTTFNPRVAVSTVLGGATVVASIGRFSQPPDFQYLVDAAFDDTMRTGRFRRGNPNLGFETSTQYELSVRSRPTQGVALRVGVYYKRLNGLVASVPLGLNPDSTIFGLTDYGTSRGLEVVLEREMRGGWGARLLYTLAKSTATSTSAFLLTRFGRIDPTTGDTVFPGRVEFPLDYDRRHTVTGILQGKVNEGAGPAIAGIRPLGGLEGAMIVRVESGLPFTLGDLSDDSVTVLPNSSRLPATGTVDLLIRRPISAGSFMGSIYLDLRNLFNRRNVVAVRRDTGTPVLDSLGLATLAQQAYQANPDPIPFESRRYRAWADTDGDGLISGQAELLPLYLQAARDYTQPLFAYGTPRLVRLGVEVRF